MTTRDPFPQPLGHDYIRAEARVAREISCAPPFAVELATALGFTVFMALFFWGLPDFAEWLSSWGFCR